MNMYDNDKTTSGVIVQRDALDRVVGFGVPPVVPDTSCAGPSVLAVMAGAGLEYGDVRRDVLSLCGASRGYAFVCPAGEVVALDPERDLEDGDQTVPVLGHGRDDDAFLHYPLVFYNGSGDEIETSGGSDFESDDEASDADDTSYDGEDLTAMINADFQAFEDSLTGLAHHGLQVDDNGSIYETNAYWELYEDSDDGETLSDFGQEGVSDDDDVAPEQLAMGDDAVQWAGTLALQLGFMFPVGGVREDVLVPLTEWEGDVLLSRMIVRTAVIEYLGCVEIYHDSLTGRFGGEVDSDPASTQLAQLFANTAEGVRGPTRYDGSVRFTRSYLVEPADVVVPGQPDVRRCALVDTDFWGEVLMQPVEQVEEFTSLCAALRGFPFYSVDMVYLMYHDFIVIAGNVFYLAYGRLRVGPYTVTYRGGAYGTVTREFASVVPCWGSLVACLYVGSGGVLDCAVAVVYSDCFGHYVEWSLPYTPANVIFVDLANLAFCGCGITSGQRVYIGQYSIFDCDGITDATVRCSLNGGALVRYVPEQ